MATRIRPIRTDKDHAQALRQIEELWGAKAGSPNAERLEVLITLVDLYEAKHHAIEPPDPIEAILFRMEQQGLSRIDLEPYIGSRARVSEVLNRKRSLTLQMIRRLSHGLNISADILLGNYIVVRKGIKLGHFNVLTPEGKSAGQFYVDVADSTPENEMVNPAWETGEADLQNRGVMIRYSVFKFWPEEKVLRAIQEAAIPNVQRLLAGVWSDDSKKVAIMSISRLRRPLRTAILKGRRRLVDARKTRHVQPSV